MKSGPTRLIARRSPIKSMPTPRLGLRRRYPSAFPSHPCLSGSASSSWSITCDAAATSRAPVGDARIEQGIDQVDHQRGEADRQNDDEDDAINEEVVGAGDRLVQQRADAWISEDHLDDHRAGDDMPQCDGKRRELWQ